MTPAHGDREIHPLPPSLSFSPGKTRRSRHAARKNHRPRPPTPDFPPPPLTLATLVPNLFPPVYELHNLSALKCFIEDTLEPGEAYMCTLNGDFLSPSSPLLARPRRRRRRRHERHPVTHACLGNHEFDHSIETLGQRLAELDCDVINTNVFACPLGEESGSAAAAAAALASPLGVPHPETSHQQPFAHDGDPSAGAFLDHLPRTATVTLGGVTVGLLGLCTTSTPLSSARRPRGVVFAECVPLARRAARTLLPTVDAVVALTHQTLPEDARLAEEVPEIAAILGGHEHTPFAGRMGHGANARAALASKGVEATTSECVHPQAGTLCVKAGMDAENVVVVTIEVPGGRGGSVEGHPRPPSATLGKDAGGECDAEAAASALAQRRPPPPRRRLRAPRKRITTSSVTEVCSPPRVSTRTRSEKKTK